MLFNDKSSITLQQGKHISKFSWPLYLPIAATVLAAASLAVIYYCYKSRGCCCCRRRADQSFDDTDSIVNINLASKISAVKTLNKSKKVTGTVKKDQEQPQSHVQKETVSVQSTRKQLLSDVNKKSIKRDQTSTTLPDTKNIKTPKQVITEPQSSAKPFDDGNKTIDSLSKGLLTGSRSFAERPPKSLKDDPSRTISKEPIRENRQQREKQKHRKSIRMEKSSRIERSSRVEKSSRIDRSGSKSVDSDPNLSISKSLKSDEAIEPIPNNDNDRVHIGGPKRKNIARVVKTQAAIGNMLAAGRRPSRSTKYMDMPRQAPPAAIQVARTAELIGDILTNRRRRSRKRGSTITSDI